MPIWDNLHDRWRHNIPVRTAAMKLENYGNIQYCTVAVRQLYCSIYDDGTVTVSGTRIGDHVGSRKA